MNARAAVAAPRRALGHVAAVLERFFHAEAASGILLIFAGALALAWANSPWAESYQRLWQASLGFRLGDLTLERSLLWLVNDGLMTIFFFVVGLEIRRELHDGELSQWRRAALPVAAAVGGIVVPASIYLALAGAAETRAGWGVPMATDIAFALGILSLLGKRVPSALRVLLLACAVIDDLAAILVIALFYSSGVSVMGLAVALAAFAAVLLLRRLGVRAPLAYVPPAIVAWAGVYAAGFHPTIAGVILGLLTPVTALLLPEEGLSRARRSLAAIAARGAPGTQDDALPTGEPSEAVPDADDAAPPSSDELSEQLRPLRFLHRDVEAPTTRLIDALHPWVAFGVMPVFALANAGVALGGAPLDATAVGVAVAVAAALVIGKPIGVIAASWLTLRLGVSSLPAGLSLRHVVVLGAVTGVGFTMSLFIAQLAFTDEGLLSAAKLGVLCASAAAAVATLVLGRALLRPVG
ncbi:MAG: Na+/H+ antiporter NhaA [Kofleriaceae bacterium]